MRMLPYLNPCCGVLTAHFSNLTKFECSHRRDIITYTHDIFNNRCKIPHYATRKMTHIENKNHQLTSQNKFRLILNKGVHFNSLTVDFFHNTETFKYMGYPFLSFLDLFDSEKGQYRSFAKVLVLTNVIFTRAHFTNEPMRSSEVWYHLLSNTFWTQAHPSPQ